MKIVREVLEERHGCQSSGRQSCLWSVQLSIGKCSVENLVGSVRSAFLDKRYAVCIRLEPRTRFTPGKSRSKLSSWKRRIKSNVGKSSAPSTPTGQPPSKRRNRSDINSQQLSYLPVSKESERRGAVPSTNSYNNG